MKKNLKLALAPALLALTLAPATLLAAPTKCPSVSAIQAGQFGMIGTDHDGSYYVYQGVDKYDTDEFWGFGIMNIKADSFDDALNKAKKELPTLTFVQGPDPDEHMWKCVYNTSAGYEATAVSWDDINLMPKFMR